MHITKIVPGVKTKGRYNIFVDGKYNFSLDEQQLLDLHIKVGDEIDDRRLRELKSESDFGKKYARAFELILRRNRSEKEIRDYAWRKKWEPEETSRIIEKLISKKYLNDEKFAASWVRTRAILKHVSRRKLILELRQKGVSSDTIEQAIEQSEDYNETQALSKLIEKKRTRYTDQQKFMAYLLRQGFDYDEIKQALKGGG